MTTEPQTDSSIDALYTDAINIGDTLKEKRLTLQLDEEDIAKALKIPLDQVRALEANQFNYFRSITFARGFLKSYCRVLSIDSNPILEAFDAEQKTPETTLKPVDKVNKQTNLGDPIVILISVVIVAVLVFLVFWWPFQTTKSSESGLASEQINEAVEPQMDTDDLALEGEDLTLLTESNAAVESQGSETLDSDLLAPSKPLSLLDNGDVVTGLSAETMAILEEAGVNPSEVVRATAKVAPEPTPMEPTPPSYSEDIVIAFEADCWTEIRDASGRILFSGVKTAGNELTLTGKAPYRVVLGYTDGVTSVIYKGEEFDFSSFTRNGLARFELK
ncbi:helix-turn-helix domain-containing protein [Marinomonas sp. A79]|uniref:Helix-turn-helix domain-containing protein n=1 Tax=Marinomonas vulgaris TaxID=2823372 RepID=A0ABS5H9H4_9GAMM|nr:RodZ domain-containing protein [Marinomonas vulgaris]MBR7888260.1 helix-turn-helix domain-containing protein [Marinomonas vulgaris]